MARSERAARCRTLARPRRVAVGVAIAAALPLAVACNSLIGLSDFEKGECPGARCGDAGVPDQLVDGGPDVSADVGPDVKGADPVSWAKWQMPNYGEGGPGEPPRPPALVVAGEIVSDDVYTKLVWRSKLLGQFKAAEADIECKKVAPAGSWRAPKRIELVTLLDYSKAGPPFVDSTKFPDIANDLVWTTSEVRPFVVGKPDQPYWVVNFNTGAVERLRGDFKANVLCVRAN